MDSFPRGAQSFAYASNPVIDLVPIVNCLAESISSKNKNLPKHRQLPLYHVDINQSVFYVDTYAVMRRLTSSKSFQKLQENGFAHNVEPPGLYERAWIGGRILDGTEPALKKAIKKLLAEIDRELDLFCKNNQFPLERLLIAGPQALINQSIKIGKFPDVFSENKISLSESKLETKSIGNKHCMARIITSIETVYGDKDSKVSDLSKGVERVLSNRDCPENDIKDISKDILESANNSSKNQINRFLDFLDQEALSRVRLFTMFNIMEAIAAEVKNKNQKNADSLFFITYVKRIHTIFRLYTHADSENLILKLSGKFNIEDVFLNEEWEKTGFYACLPVWPRWAAQLFEAQPQQTQTVKREISYRFRINGTNPEADGKPAFEARIDKIEHILLKQNDEKIYKVRDVKIYKIRRALAELIFFSAVFSHRKTSIHNNQEKLDQEINNILSETVKWINKSPKKNIRKALTTLRNRSIIATKVADTLINTLKNPTKRLASRIFHKPFRYYLNIKKDLIDWSRLESGASDFFACGTHPNQEKIHFFSCLEVSQGENNSKNYNQRLMSIPMEVSLQEHGLIPTDNECNYHIKRNIPHCLTQVVWRPFQAKSVHSSSNNFILQRHIELLYSYDYLAPTQKTTEKSKDLLAAFRTAFTILCYMVLNRIFFRLNEMCKEDLAVVSLRLQEDGKSITPDLDDDLSEDKWKNKRSIIATESVYAASHAIELMIGQDYNFKMQGFALKGVRYREHNTFTGLYSALPMEIKATTSPHLDKVGIITLAARPCDIHPKIVEPQRRQYVLLARSYLLTKSQKAYIIQSTGNRSKIAATADAIEQPALIPEAIDALCKQGCRHILYIAHRFEDRRIGRSDYRLRLHDNPDFLNHLNENFKDISLYPLVRDVVPAFRFTGRRSNKQQGIEITHVKNFQSEENFRRLHRDNSISYIPIYALGTLKVVGEESKRPQSGCCTYFFLNDQRAADQERSQRLNSQIILQSSTRNDLLMALRALHFMESEQRPQRGTAFPVLDPYAWIHPTTIQAIGDIEYSSSRRQKPIILSLSAVLSRLADIVHSL